MSIAKKCYEKCEAMAEEIKINVIVFVCLVVAIPITFAWAYVLGRKDEHKIAMEFFDEALSDDDLRGEPLTKKTLKKANDILTKNLRHKP